MTVLKELLVLFRLHFVLSRHYLNIYCKLNVSYGYLDNSPVHSSLICKGKEEFFSTFVYGLVGLFSFASARLGIALSLWMTGILGLWIVLAVGIRIRFRFEVLVFLDFGLVVVSLERGMRDGKKEGFTKV